LKGTKTKNKKTERDKMIGIIEGELYISMFMMFKMLCVS